MMYYEIELQTTGTVGTAAFMPFYNEIDAYEKHHQVVIEEEAIRAAVQMSARYINDRILPEKFQFLCNKVRKLCVFPDVSGLCVRLLSTAH